MAGEGAQRCAQHFSPLLPLELESPLRPLLWATWACNFPEFQFLQPEGGNNKSTSCTRLFMSFKGIMWIKWVFPTLCDEGQVYWMVVVFYFSLSLFSFHFTVSNPLWTYTFCYICGKWNVGKIVMCWMSWQYQIIIEVSLFLKISLFIRQTEITRGRQRGKQTSAEQRAQCGVKNPIF